MEVLATRAMGLAARERLKLRRIEEGLRADDPGLDTLLADGPPQRGPALRLPAAGVLAVYLVPAVLVLAGLVLHATWLVLGGVVACPFVPVLSWWLLIRRRLVRGVPGHRRGP
jgi:Flp pilus assembly protein TadB